MRAVPSPYSLSINSQELRSLLGSVDVLVSLHRSESYGLALPHGEFFGVLGSICKAAFNPCQYPKNL